MAEPGALEYVQCLEKDQGSVQEVDDAAAALAEKQNRYGSFVNRVGNFHGD